MNESPVEIDARISGIAPAKRALAYAVRYFGVAHIEVDPELLRSSLGDAIGDSAPGVSEKLTDDLMLELAEETQSALGCAAAAFAFKEFRAPQSQMAKRLVQFRDGLGRLAHALGVTDEVLESSGKKRDMVDLGVLRFVARVGSDAELLEKEILARYQAARDTIAPILAEADIAVQAFDALAKGGRPDLSEYDAVVEVALLIAKRLGLEPTTAGDREGTRKYDPYSTPFTRLVFECLERFLPEDLQDARSPSLAACARRIERCGVWRERRGLA